MGLTPLEGLMMAKRSGDVDPSIFDILARSRLGYSIEETLNMLNSQSGLLGIAGSQDSRQGNQSHTCTD